MANKNGTRRGFTRFLMEGADRLFLGNRAYDPRADYWSGQGALQGGIQSGLGAINPLLGIGARLYFNHQNRNNGVGGTTLANLAPAQNLTFNPGQFQQYPALRFDPNGVDPPANPAPSGPIGGRQQNRPAMTGGMGGLSGIASQMGGARGAYSGGGYTGDAARAMFAGMTSGPMYFDTMGNSGPYNQ